MFSKKLRNESVDLSLKGFDLFNENNVLNHHHHITSYENLWALIYENI